MYISYNCLVNTFKYILYMYNVGVYVLKHQNNMSQTVHEPWVGIVRFEGEHPQFRRNEHIIVTNYVLQRDGCYGDSHI